MSHVRDAARQAFVAALAALDTRALTVRAAEEVLGGAGRPVWLVALGKAAAPMAAGVADAAGPRLRGGVVVTKDGHGRLAPLRPSLELREAAHPTPDARSAAAGEALLAAAAGVPADGRLVVAVSGGASALAAAPAWGLSLAEKVATTSAVASAGAPIAELNAVRKHLSRLKGGRLAAASAAPVTALVLSDVLGDDLATVGGGPAVPDPTTFADALAVLDARGVDAPPAVRRALEDGARGRLPETPKRLDHVDAHRLAGPDDLLDAAERALAQAGVPVAGVERRVADEVPAFAARLAARARALAAGLPPGERRAYLAGGEPTLRLPARPGRGGRAQHAALLVARALAAAPLPPGVELAVLCAGSDGTDGPTDDAGGLVDAGTWARAAAAGVDPDAALAAYDSGRALAAAGDLVTTGPTGTNLCDLAVVVAISAPQGGPGSPPASP